MEGYKPQDFSFFHRSEKLVQQHIVLGRTDGVSSSELKAKIAIKLKNN